MFVAECRLGGFANCKQLASGGLQVASFGGRPKWQGAPETPVLRGKPPRCPAARRQLNQGRRVRGFGKKFALLPDLSSRRLASQTEFMNKTRNTLPPFVRKEAIGVLNHADLQLWLLEAHLNRQPAKT
jgi:hypothetical protein